jgi:hypothetical protein
MRHVSLHIQLLCLSVISGGWVWVGSAFADIEPIWTIGGTATNQSLGFRALGLGDTNSDGKADFAIASPGWNSNTGKVEVRSGVNGTVLYTWNGVNSGDWFGYSLASAGDVDSDGVTDILVGTRRTDFAYPKYARLISGATGAAIRYFTEPNAWLARYGEVVIGNVDLNNDGTNDIVIAGLGDPSQSNGTYEHGRVWVYSGANYSLLYSFDPSGTSLPFANLTTLIGISDVNSDGRDDLAVLSSQTALYILSGQNGSTIRTITMPGFASSLLDMGDANSDGITDLIAANILSEPMNAYSSYVYSGSNGNFIRRFDHCEGCGGAAIAVTPDLNADNIADVLMFALNMQWPSRVVSGANGMSLGSGYIDTPVQFVYVEHIGETDNDGLPEFLVYNYFTELSGSPNNSGFASLISFLDFCRVTPNLLIQNQTYSSTATEQSNASIFAGRNVDPTQTAGDVVVNTGANVGFEAGHAIFLGEGFRVLSNAQFSAEVDMTSQCP